MPEKQEFVLEVFTEKKQEDVSSAGKERWIKYLFLLPLLVLTLVIVETETKIKGDYRDINTFQNTTKMYATRSMFSLNEMSAMPLYCSTSQCVVKCSGDMTSLNSYLAALTGCNAYVLQISDSSFPGNRLQSNWLVGNFNLQKIEIKTSNLKGIDDGAFNHESVAKVEEINFDGVQLEDLNENTFIGLISLVTFTLTNNIEIFSGDSFLKPMESSLAKVVIKHVTNTPTDPGPWLRGGAFAKLMTIVFDNSNFGGYIKAETFQHLTGLYYIMMNSCKITQIGDGAFDFLMQKIVVLVSLDNNQLKRLSGDYLTKVTSLKRIVITNNPWDCTCELEGLINEFKRYPDGFGNSTKCTSPAKYAGVLFSDAVVEHCEDTATTLDSTTSTTTTTTTVVTPSTNISSSTEPVTTSSTEVNVSTGFTSSESTPPDPITQPPPSSINTPQELPSSSTDSSEMPLSTASSESPTDPIISTASSLIASNTTELSTTTVSESSLGPATNPETTLALQDPTTTLSVDTMFIECQRNTVNLTITSTATIHFVELSRPDTHFDISSTSQTSAAMEIENHITGQSLIWFYDQPMIDDHGENAEIVEEVNIGCQSNFDNTLLIEGLSQNRAYTFCIIMKGILVISPFNCQSFCTSNNNSKGIPADEVWLKFNDRALTIGMSIMVFVLSMCFGIVSTFLVVRCYPSLLKGSKRVIVVNRSTGDALMLPRPKVKSPIVETDYSYNKSSVANTTIHKRRISKESIKSGLSYMEANNYEDIEYIWKMNIANDMTYENRVPTIPAPPLPKRGSQVKRLLDYNDKKMRVAVILPKGNDYGYMA